MAKAPKKSAAKKRSTTKATATATRKRTAKSPAKKRSSKKAAPTKKAARSHKKATKKKAAKKTATTKKKRAVTGSATSSTEKQPESEGEGTPRKLSAADKKFFEQQQKVLIEERATYLQQADALQAEADLLVAEREPGDVQFDEESGEGDTLAVERERDLALSAQARAAISEIDLALRKIEDGTYGICEVSGKPIPRERLRAIPWARVRVEYKTGGIGPT